MKKLLSTFRAAAALAVAAPIAAVVVPTVAFAQTATTGQDYSTLTEAVDWSSAITAIMAVGAVLAGVYVVFKGIRFVLKMIR